MEPFNQNIGIYTIEYYYSWTSLDDLVGSLTIRVPEKIELSEEEYVELILYIQYNLIKAANAEEYKFDFYYQYFNNNYSIEIRNEIFIENVDVMELAKKMKNFQKDVIAL